MANQRVKQDTYADTGLSPWNVVLSLIVVIVNEIMGLFANCLILFIAYKNQIGNQTVRSILTAIAIKNLTALVVCLPLATAMICKPVYIMETTCYIQEIGTFTVLYASLLFPTVLSVDRLDVIRRPRNRLINRNRVILIIVIVSLTCVFLGFFPLVIHDDRHGCHLWSTRVDDAILLYAYVTLACVVVSLWTMGYCYTTIYKHTKTHVDNLNRYNNSHIQNVRKQIQSINDTGHVSTGIRDAWPIYKGRMRMDVNILLPCALTIGVIVACWIPWLVVNFIIANSENNETINAEARVITLALVYIPISSDPLIFIFVSSKGRRAVMKVLSKHKDNNTDVAQTVLSQIAEKQRDTVA